MTSIQLVPQWTVHAGEIVTMQRNFWRGVIHASGSGEVGTRIVCTGVNVNLTLVP